MADDPQRKLCSLVHGGRDILAVGVAAAAAPQCPWCAARIADRAQRDCSRRRPHTANISAPSCTSTVSSQRAALAGTAGFQPAPTERLEAGGPNEVLQTNAPDPALTTAAPRSGAPALANLT